MSEGVSYGDPQRIRARIRKIARQRQEQEETVEDVTSFTNNAALGLVQLGQKEGPDYRAHGTGQWNPALRFPDQPAPLCGTPFI